MEEIIWIVLSIMPYAIRKVKGGYQVKNTQTGKIHAAKTSKANAEAQVRLLQALEHGMIPRKKK
jgi:ssDNA-binding replication factor A large subunit